MFSGFVVGVSGFGFRDRDQDRRVFLAARDHAVFDLGDRDQGYGPRHCPEVGHLSKVVKTFFSRTTFCQK